MTSGLHTDLGAASLYDPFRSSLLNDMDKCYLENNAGESIETGDVMVLDLDIDESMIAGSDSYPYRPVFVVPSDIDSNGDASTKTIIDGDSDWVYRPGAYVPLANVDGAVEVGEWLALSSTPKSFTGLGVGIDDCYPPLAAKAYALAEATEAGEIPVILLEDTANCYMGCRVYNSEDIDIDASTPTALTFDSEEYDDGGLHSTVSNTGRLTVPADQTGSAAYHIVGHVTWSGAPSGAYVAIRLNGTTVIERKDMGTGLLSIDIDTQYELSAGDYVELLVYTTSSSLSIKYYAKYSPAFMMLRTTDQ